jgi:hypothetical protein
MTIIALGMNSMSGDDTSYQLMKEEIGEMIVALAFFEHRLDVMIFNLAGSKEWGFRISSQLAKPASKFKAIIDLCRLRLVPEHLVEELNKISQDSERLSLQRNRFVHDPWFDGGVQLYKEYVENKLDHYEPRELQLGNINEFIANVTDINYRMAQIRTNILQMLGLRPPV